MLLGYNTSGLQNHRLEDALRLLADSGYRAVAITPDVMHLDPFRITAGEIRSLADTLDRLELKPVMETGARFLLDARHKHEPTLMTVDAAGRQRRLDFYGRVAGLGAELGAEVVSFWTGIDRHPGPDSVTRMHDGVRAACERIRAAGLVPALEPEPGMAVETVAGYRALRLGLGSEAPDLTLDVGHLYAVPEGDPVAVASSCAGFLAQVHLEDMRWGRHLHLPPGEGDVDFAGILNAFDKSGYGGPVCFELSRDSHRAPECVALCRELWWSLGLADR